MPKIFLLIYLILSWLSFKSKIYWKTLKSVRAAAIGKIKERLNVRLQPILTSDVYGIVRSLGIWNPVFID